MAAMRARNVAAAVLLLLLPAARADDPAPAANPGETPAPSKPAPPALSRAAAAARELLLAAAKRQGTGDLVGEREVRRFQAEFDPVKVFGEHAVQTSSVETFALPVAPSTEARLRSEWLAGGKSNILGHNGRFGWNWIEGEGARRFTDPVRGAEDMKDVDQRRSLLRLALRVFFLGNLATEGERVARREDAKITIPVGDRGDSKTHPCSRVDRAAGDGDPALRLCLSVEEKDGWQALDPVAAFLLPGKADDPTWLLTFGYDVKETRKPEDLPNGVRVPIWLELFEVPSAKEAARTLRMQAGVKRLEIDPAKIPDALFEVPREK
jgi:hypothetical protein